MPDKTEENSPSEATSKVSKATGVIWNLLPGESNEHYQQGLRSTMDELGAKTSLQIYIAEKIFQCLWWMRRYETQKRSIIIKAMVDVLIGVSAEGENRRVIAELFYNNQFESPRLSNIYKAKGLTPESLLERGMSKQQEEIEQLDQQIALRTKTLLSLQQSYEALVNRTLVRDRLKIQNELLKRDLKAIDVEALPQVRGPNDKPKAKSRK